MHKTGKGARASSASALGDDPLDGDEAPVDLTDAPVDQVTLCHSIMPKAMRSKPVVSGKPCLTINTTPMNVDPDQSKRSRPSESPASSLRGLAPLCVA